MTSSMLLTFTLILYLCGSAVLGAHLLLRRPRWLLAGRILGAIATLSHAAAIGLRCVDLHRAPFTTPAEALSLVAWNVGILCAILSFWKKLASVGTFALGLCFLLVFAGGLGAGTKTERNPLLSETAISFHIWAILGGLAAFALAFCCAFLYIVEHRILKSKHGLAWMKTLPPLMQVEKAGFLLACVGFPLWVLGVASGFLHGFLAVDWHSLPKMIFSCGIAIIYAFYFFTRLKQHWSPLKTSYILLGGLIASLALFLIR
jgi:HemX protein